MTIWRLKKQNIWQLIAFLTKTLLRTNKHSNVCLFVSLSFNRHKLNVAIKNDKVLANVKAEVREEALLNYGFLAFGFSLV